jgi:hypothetical protein
VFKAALRAGLGVLVLALTVLLALPASATPTPSPTPGVATVAPKPVVVPQGQGQGDTSYSGKMKGAREYEFGQRVEKATSPAHTNSKGQIDFRWVKKSFGKHTSERDGFATGWWSRRHDWKQFTHISSSDKKSIVKWSKSHRGPNPTYKTAPLMLRKEPKPCTGVSAYFTVGSGMDKEWWSYLNSCDTDHAVVAATICAPFVGVIGAIGGVLTAGVAAIPAAVGVLGCVGNLVWLTTCRDNSTVESVNIRIRHIAGGKRYQWPYNIYAQ